MSSIGHHCARHLLGPVGATDRRREVAAVLCGSWTSEAYACGAESLLALAHGQGDATWQYFQQELTVLHCIPMPPLFALVTPLMELLASALQRADLGTTGINVDMTRPILA